ncbi:MAG TPA: sigma 54-interacting transcriptional regulator [Gemmataceae bacterium]
MTPLTRKLVIVWSWSWQKVLILTVALAMGGFVVGVFWQVQTLPEIGLHTTLRNVVNRADPDYLRTADGLPSAELKDVLKEAAYEQIGDERIETYPQRLDAIKRLDRKNFAEGDRLSPRGGGNYVHWNDADWVRVRLRTADSPPNPVTVWCRVGRPTPAALVPTVVWFALQLAVFAVAGFVYWKRPGDRPARQFFIMTAVFIAAFMGGYHWWRLVYEPPLLLGFIISAVFLPAVSLHFYLLFPRPKPVLAARPGLVLGLTYGIAAAFAAAIVAGYAVVLALHSGGAAAGLVNAAVALVRGTVFVYLIVALALYSAIVWCLADSFRAARDATERDQVRWIFYGSVLASVPLVYALFLALFRPSEFGGGAATWPMFAASVCFTGSFAVSITRYRLLQLDQLISSGMAYFLVSGTAAAVYYALVFAGALVMGEHGAGPSLQQAFWVSGVALVMTVGLDLARSRLRRALDRRFRRDKTQLDHTLHLLGEAVEQLVEPPTLARRLLRAAADLLGVATGAVYLRDGDPPTFRVAGGVGPIPPAAELPADSSLVTALGSAETIPPRAGAVSFDALAQLRAVGGAAAVALAHEGVLRAVLVLGPKAGGGDYTREDLDLLAAFAPFTALALASAEGHRTIEALNRELQTKVEKIGEQQRRILALQQQLTTQAKFALSAVTAKPAEEPAEPFADGIVGGGAALRQVLGLARKVAASPSAVLIRGESGTGKGLLAKAIHENSPRAGRPFVKVHCAALAPGLLESELFGHVKGAFTGAVRDKVGRFELADGGTLFLDEIGDITVDVQTKLLRVLQEKTFERVGSSEPVQVDVRLVAATHQNLEHLIRQGKFREDLYYRLNVITLAVPPLRDRPEDVAELAHHFLKLYAQRCGKTITQVDDDALVALRAYRWPGNVRELENAIERAVVVADGSILTTDDLPTEVRRAPETDLPVAAPAVALDGARWGVRAERDLRDRQEREALLRALATAGGNKAEAARLLAMARSTLVSRLKKHGLLTGKWDG